MCVNLIFNSLIKATPEPRLVFLPPLVLLADSKLRLSRQRPGSLKNAKVAARLAWGRGYGLSNPRLVYFNGEPEGGRKSAKAQASFSHLGAAKGPLGVCPIKPVQG